MSSDFLFSLFFFFLAHKVAQTKDDVFLQSWCTPLTSKRKSAMAFIEAVKLTVSSEFYQINVHITSSPASP